MSETQRPTIPTPDERRPLTPVEHTAWGLTLYARPMSAARLTAIVEIEDPTRFTGQLLIESICYADGAPVWGAEALDTVLAYPMEDLQPLAEVARRVNGLESQAMEERKGNSDGGPVTSSSSGSPSGSEG